MSAAPASTVAGRRAGDLPRYAAAALSGLGLVLVSPPISATWLEWFLFVPFLVVLDPERPRLNFRVGYLAGFVAIYAIFSWLIETIHTFGQLPVPVAMAVLALFAAVWGLPYGALAWAAPMLRRRFGGWWVLAVPSFWVTLEYLQPALFPYYLGGCQYRAPWVWQSASVIGALGLSWFVFLVNTTLAEAALSFREGRRPPWATLGVVALLFVGNLGYGAWRHARVEAALAEAQVLRVAVLQQGVTMVQRLKDRGATILKSWIKLTQEAAAHDPDLVVWPEGSIYSRDPSKGDYATILGKLAKAGDFHLVLGGGTHEPDPVDVEKFRSWNSVYMFRPDGAVGGRYDKMVPLPFGEYLPFPFAFLRPYVAGIGNFRAGDSLTQFEVDGLTFSTPICYEAILERQMLRMSDVDFYVNVTNDAWFGDTAAPHQHAMLSAVHAMEFGRPMLRIAYTGVGMVVEPHGEIPYETKPYTDVADVVPLRVATFETPYRTWGRLFPLLAALSGAALVFVAWRDARQNPVTSKDAPS